MRAVLIQCVATGLVVGACSFSAPSHGEGDDGAVGPDAPMPQPDVPLQIVPCNTPDPTGLVLCLEIEDGVADGMLYDSSPGRRHATTSGLSDFDRMLASATSKAAHVTGNSVTYVAQDSGLELAGAFTLAAWVMPDSLPADGVARGILDHERQYAMYVRGTTGTVMTHHCAFTGGDYEWTEALPEDAWSFVACTWTGTELCAYRWTSPSSHEQFCRVATAPSANGAQGLAIGHLSNAGAAHMQFDGKLDSVQVYNRGLTETQLCAMLERGQNCM